MNARSCKHPISHRGHGLEPRAFWGGRAKPLLSAPPPKKSKKVVLVNTVRIRKDMYLELFKTSTLPSDFTRHRPRF